MSQSGENGGFTNDNVGEEGDVVYDPQRHQERQDEDVAVASGNGDESLATVMHPDSSENCSICHSPMNSQTQISLNPCNHSFCAQCIVPWLRRDRRCPLCRNREHPESEDEENEEEDEEEEEHDDPDWNEADATSADHNEDDETIPEDYSDMPNLSEDEAIAEMHQQAEEMGIDRHVVNPIRQEADSDDTEDSDDTDDAEERRRRVHNMEQHNQRIERVIQQIRRNTGSRYHLSEPQVRRHAERVPLSEPQVRRHASSLTFPPLATTPPPTTAGSSSSFVDPVDRHHMASSPSAMPSSRLRNLLSASPDISRQHEAYLLHRHRTANARVALSARIMQLAERDVETQQLVANYARTRSHMYRAHYQLSNNIRGINEDLLREIPTEQNHHVFHIMGSDDANTFSDARNNTAATCWTIPLIIPLTLSSSPQCAAAAEAAAPDM